MKKYKVTFNGISRGFIIYLCVTIRVTTVTGGTDSSGEEFLNSVINQLRSNQIPFAENYRAFYNSYSLSRNYDMHSRSSHTNENDDNNENYQEIPNNNFNNNAMYVNEETYKQFEEHNNDDEQKMDDDLNEFSSNNNNSNNNNNNNGSSKYGEQNNEENDFPLNQQYSDNSYTANLQYPNTNINSFAVDQFDHQNIYNNDHHQQNAIYDQQYLTNNGGNSFQNMDHLIDNFMMTTASIGPSSLENNVADSNGMMQKKPVEPLFVAMAGFVSVAMIFMGAMIFLPKLLTPPSPVVGTLKKGPQEIAALTKLAMEAMEGNDCTERIACEVGRAMKSFQVGSKPIRIMEIILPTNMSKQLAQIRKALISEQTCKLITCKRIIRNEKKPVPGKKS